MPVPGQGSDIAGSTEASDAARDWEAVRASADIQYAPLPPIKIPEPPGWLKQLGEWLRSLFEPVGKAIGMSWPTIQYILIALAILCALFLLWRLVVEPLLERRRRPKVAVADEWAPARAHAVALHARLPPSGT